VVRRPRIGSIKTLYKSHGSAYVKKTEEEKRLARRLRLQWEQIQKLNQQIDELKNDRDLFRNHFVSRFQWWFRLMKANQTPSLTWLAENDAMWLRQFKWWPFDENKS